MRRIRLVCWPPLLLTLATAGATLRVLAPFDRTCAVRLHLPGGREQLVVVRTGPQGVLPSARIWILERGGPLAWRRVQSETVEEVDSGKASDILRFENLSGDGVPELLVAFCWGNGGRHYKVWKYTASSHWAMAAEDLANPVWCPRQRCVLEWSRGGCGNFDARRLVWEGDTLRAVEEVSQQKLFSSWRKGYHLRVSRLKDGAMTLVREWESPTPHAWAQYGEEGWEPPDGLLTLDSASEMMP